MTIRTRGLEVGVQEDGKGPLVPFPLFVFVCFIQRFFFIFSLLLCCPVDSQQTLRPSAINIPSIETSTQPKSRTCRDPADKTRPPAGLVEMHSGLLWSQYIVQCLKYVLLLNIKNQQNFLFLYLHVLTLCSKDLEHPRN